KALAFSIHAHTPDGFLPAINDGDVNSYLSLLRKAHRYYPSEELLYAASQGEEGKPPRQRSRAFPDSGYCVLRSGWSERPYRDGRYFFFDCGKLGFGSHGHYDLLGFEAAAFGRSLVVDPGRYTYSEDSGDGVNWRHAFKGTAAHNTVMVDGKDQIAYRCHAPVGPEPTASLLGFVSAPGFDFAHGRALSPQYPVEHQRSVFFAESEYWIVSDLLIGSGTHRYDQFFHLSPDALDQTRLLAERQGRGIASPNLMIVQPSATGIDIAIEQGFASPQYGIKHPAPVIRFTQETEGTARFLTVLYPFLDVPPDIRVSEIPVSCVAGPVADRRAIALRIFLQLGDSVFDDRYFVAHEAGGMDFSFDDITCRAQVLFVRRNAIGEVLSIQANAIESLRIGSRTLLNGIGERVRLSYSNGRLHLATEERQWEGASPSLDALAEHVAMLTAPTEA
ncbi:MAG: hypothetical protein H6R26_913, partial [Proteobacteria bacterium]|nr:hypothetical protein [Pseudomonadota bacterium]